MMIRLLHIFLDLSLLSIVSARYYIKEKTNFSSGEVQR